MKSDDFVMGRVLITSEASNKVLKCKAFQVLISELQQLQQRKQP